MYSIYHIPGVKIGCSTQVQKRIKEQGFTNCTILEEHTDIFVASDREIQLQKQYGYKVDTIPYWKSAKTLRKNATYESAKKGGLKGGKTSKELEHIQRAQKIGCKIGGKVSGIKRKESGLLYQYTLKSMEKTSKPIIATNIKTGEILKFKSQNEFSRIIGVPSGNVTKLLKYKKGKTIKGYTLQYA